MPVRNCQLSVAAGLTPERVRSAALAVCRSDGARALFVFDEHLRARQGVGYGAQQ